MARKKGNRGGGEVWDNYYKPHLNGGKTNRTNDLQVATENMYMDLLTELCANRFKWEGLPDSISPRFLELLLFETGLAVVYNESKIGKLIAIRAAQVGLPNYEGDPTKYQVIAPGADNIYTEVGIKQCVPVWANYLRKPEVNKVLIYARKLAAIDRTIELNVANMRYTKVVTVNENQRLTYMNLVKQHEEGAPLIMGSTDLDLSKIQALDIGVPVEAVPNLQIAKAKMWNECMSMLGINNANQDKRERLVADEVNANDEQIDSVRNIALNSRKLAAEKINEMFDCNITVDFQTKVELDADIAFNDTTNEGDEE